MLIEISIYINKKITPSMLTNCNKTRKTIDQQTPTPKLYDNFWKKMIILSLGNSAYLEKNY